MSLKQKAVKGTAWAFLEQVSLKGVNFFVQILLARILLPEDFGLIAMMTIFITIGYAVVDSGMAQSLIRTKDANQGDFSTVFFLNVAVSVFFYLFIYLVAPAIAKFYDKPELVSLLRVFGLVIPIKSFMMVQKSILTKKLNFKKQMLIQTPSLLISGVLGIYLAKALQNAWALVYMQLCFVSLMTLLFWIFTSWRPKMILDINKLKVHFNFGYKLTLNSLVNAFFAEIYNIVIGKYFSASMLGLYNRAHTFQFLPGFIVARTINRVTYPLFSEIQNENERLKSAYKKITLQIMLLFTPIMVFFFYMSEEFIVFLLTEKWIEASPFLKILAIGGITFPISAYNWNILNAKGRSDLVLKVNLIAKGITVFGLFIALPFGIMTLVYSRVLTSLISLSLFCIYSGKYINYSIFEQYKDLAPIIINAFGAGLISWYLVGLIHIESNIILLVLFVLVFSFLYFGVFLILKYKPLLFTLSLLRERLQP